MEKVATSSHSRRTLCVLATAFVFTYHLPIGTIAAPVSTVDAVVPETASYEVETTPKTSVLAATEGSWEVCADAEGATCTCTGTVAYGRKFASGKPGSGTTTTIDQLKSTGHEEKEISGSVSCSNSAMGDPLFGYYKYCMCKSSAPTASPTVSPTNTPTDAPTVHPTATPADAPSAAPTLTGIWAFKRGGSPGSFIAEQVMNTLQQCQNWCYLDSSCNAITYHSDKRCFKLGRTYDGNFEASDTCIVSNKETDMRPGGKKGWLLTSSTQTGALWDFESGRSPGSNKGKTQQPSFKDCMDKCASITGCEAVVYNWSTDCWALNRKYEGKYQMSHHSIVANMPSSSNGVAAQLGWQITDS